MDPANDLILLVCAAIVLAPVCCMVVWMFIVVCEDILWRISDCYVRVIAWLQREDK